MKEETRVAGPWEFGDFGERNRQGARTDLQRLKVLLDEGKNEKQINQEEFELWSRHYKIISRHILLNAAPREERTKLIILIGK